MGQLNLDLDLPFRQLRLSRELVCEFFGAFSRFEFALKESGFYRPNRYDRAMPDWERFAQERASRLAPREGSELQAVLQVLLDQPAQVQVVDGHAIRWVHVALRGDSEGERAVDAVQRVRNNLFHGGKHSPQSDPVRDESLLRSALDILDALLQLDDEVRFNYENAAF